MNRIDVKQRLPADGQYVLVHLLISNWADHDDPEGNRYFRVVKFVKGISEDEREKLPNNDPRKFQYVGGDTHGNNLVPYYWTEFGPSTFFGQEVDFWWELPR